MKKIEVRTNIYTFVDDDDYRYLIQFKWYLSKKRVFRWDYNRVTQKATNISMQEEVLRTKSNNSLVIDHKNHNILDNRKSNLRICSKAQNGMNRLPNKNTISGYKGVKSQKNRWQAKIVINGKRLHLGSFSTPTEAAKAYNQAAIKYFGEFAFLNTLD